MSPGSAPISFLMRSKVRGKFIRARLVISLRLCVNGVIIYLNFQDAVCTRNATTMHAYGVDVPSTLHRLQRRAEVN